MSEDYEEKEVYVLLDFDNKDMTKLLKQQAVYLRMLNLGEDKPIVEIGEDVFEGVYEDVAGTNVFFEEVEDDGTRTNLFEKETPIMLKYFLKQSKILNLKQIGTKSALVINPRPTETLNIDIKDDYRTLLDKFKNKTLNVDDYIVEHPCIIRNDDDDDEDEEQEDDEGKEEGQEAILHTDEEQNKSSKQKLASLPERVTSISEWYSSVKEATSLSENPIYAKYLKLQKLAEQPVKHKVITEEIANNQTEKPSQSSPKNNFITWKDMMMRVVERQPINLEIDRHNMEHFVDIENSIKLGIIESSDVTPRLFTKHEKQNLLSFKNFINLTPLMKLVILQDCLQYEMSEVENMNEEQARGKGEDGLSPNDRVVLLKDFKDELKSHIMNRFRDAQKQKEILSTTDFDFNLSDESYEESSTDDFDDTDSDHMSVDEKENKGETKEQ